MRGGEDAVCVVERLLRRMRPCRSGFVPVVRNGYVVDHVLVHRRECDVRGQRQLRRRLDTRAAAAEVEQQPLHCEQGHRAVNVRTGRVVAKQG